MNTLRKWILVCGLVLFSPALFAQYTLSYSTNGGVITLTGFTGSPGSLTISNFVNVIGAQAFFDCYSLTNITIPSNVTNIGDSAFIFSGLASVTISNGVTSIGTEAFAYCRFSTITIPASVTNIGTSAFQACDNDNFKWAYFYGAAPTFGQNVFMYDYPAKIGYIPGSKGWSALTQTFGIPPLLLWDPTNQIVYGTNGNATTVYGYSGSGGAVAVPATLGGFAVTSIATNSFYQLPAVTSVAIPSAVTNIGSQAFYASGITNITLPAAVKTIGASALSDCASLVSISVQAGNSNFSGANGVLFDNTGGTLLQYPGGLSNSYTIPNSVTNIGAHAFWAASVTNITIPPTFTSIGASAFQDCTGLVNVTIPDTVTYIGAYAFYGCSHLAQLVIPNSVTSFGYHVFDSCGSLTTVQLPASMTDLGDYAFSYCSSLTAIFAAGNAPGSIWDSFDGDSTTIYTLPSATGWGSSYLDMPVVVWNPAIVTTDGNFGVRNNQFGFTVTGAANLPILINTATNPAGPWTLLQSCNVTNGSISFSDPGWSNYPNRFYTISFP